MDTGGDSLRWWIPSTIAYLVRQYYLAWSRPDLVPRASLVDVASLRNFRSFFPLGHLVSARLVTTASVRLPGLPRTRSVRLLALLLLLLVAAVVLRRPLLNRQHHLSAAWSAAAASDRPPARSTQTRSAAELIAERLARKYGTMGPNPLVIEPLGKHTASVIFSQLRPPLRALDSGL